MLSNSLGTETRVATRRSTRQRSVITVLLSLCALVFAFAAPGVAQEKKASVAISRDGGKFIVQGWNFPKDSDGVVWAMLGTTQIQKGLHTDNNGYFTMRFYKFGRSPAGLALAASRVAGVHAYTQVDLRKASSSPTTTSAPTAPVARVANTTTTAPRPVATTQAPKPVTTQAPAPQPAPTTAAPRAAAAPAPAAAPAGWNLVLSDDFNGNTVDQSKWGIYEGVGNGGTAHRVRSAVSQANGELNITGSGSTGGGLATLHQQTYGRYEIRAKFDRGAGFGSAILLWPASENWPTDGEIDISEITDPDRQSMGAHNHWGANNTTVHHKEDADFTQWHTFALDWLPDRVVWYLDGREIWRTTQSESIPHTKHFLGMQFDTADGSYIPWPNASTPAKVNMHIDYVKVYAKA